MMRIRAGWQFVFPILGLTGLVHDASAQSETDLCENTLESGTYGSITRAMFTSSVSNREPADQLTSWDPNRKVVFFFTEILDGTGTRITHRWLENGQPVTELHFNVGGPRWRVWSTKRYFGQVGDEWTVEVVDDRGCSLGHWSIKAEPAPPPEPELPEPVADDAVTEPPPEA